MPLSCDEKIDCPRAQRRKRDGYSEVCLPGSRQWYKFRFESRIYTEKQKRNFHWKIYLMVMETKFLKQTYDENEKYLDKANGVSGIPTIITHVSQHNDTAICYLYYLIPITNGEGDFHLACNVYSRATFSVSKDLDCTEFQDYMEKRKIKKGPKCFYAIEKGDRLNELKMKLGIKNSESLRVGILSPDLPAVEWHLAPDNLDAEKEEEDEEEEK